MLGGKVGEFREAPAERRGNPEPSPLVLLRKAKQGEGAETKRPPSFHIFKDDEIVQALR